MNPSPNRSAAATLIFLFHPSPILIRLTCRFRVKTKIRQIFSATTSSRSSDSSVSCSAVLHRKKTPLSIRRLRKPTRSKTLHRTQTSAPWSRRFFRTLSSFSRAWKGRSRSYNDSPNTPKGHGRRPEAGRDVHHHAPHLEHGAQRTP